MKNSILLCVLSLCLFGCQSGAKSPEEVRNLCASAQSQLNKLGCPEAKTPKGAPFEKVCQEMLNDKIDPGAKCLSTIKSCSEVNSCKR